MKFIYYILLLSVLFSCKAKYITQSDLKSGFETFDIKSIYKERIKIGETSFYEGKNYIELGNDYISTSPNYKYYTIFKEFYDNGNIKEKGLFFGGIDEEGNTKREPFLSLAHELWHAWENWIYSKKKITKVQKEWVSKTDIHGKESIQELTASQFENKIRVEHNFPRRKWYGYTENLQTGEKKGYGKIF